jgi:transcriptional regulator with XRE-family HTH domain
MNMPTPRRKPKDQPVARELRRQIKEQLVSLRQSGTQVSEMAAKLEVLPATVYQLLEGETTPTAAVLCNSCRNLAMSFQVDGFRIGATDFPAKTQRPPLTEIQLGLFELKASAISNELSISVKKANTAIELDVRLAG